MIQGVIRYKEPTNIENSIKKIGKEKNIFTSRDTQKDRRYKKLNACYKCLKIAEKKSNKKSKRIFLG
jgi:hypothetical protein